MSVECLSICLAELGVQQTGMTAEQYMPQSARDQLQEISRWLVENLSTTDFMIRYAQTRASVLSKSLHGYVIMRRQFLVASFLSTVSYVLCADL